MFNTPLVDILVSNNKYHTQTGKWLILVSASDIKHKVVDQILRLHVNSCASHA